MAAGNPDNSDSIIYAALAIAVVFGVLAFFFTPAYEKGAWAVISLIVLVVTNVLSFKFGVHVAKPQSQSDTTKDTPQ